MDLVKAQITKISTGLLDSLSAKKLATLQELKTIYDLEDKMNLYEAGIVPRMNEYWAHEQAQKNAKRNK